MEQQMAEYTQASFIGPQLPQPGDETEQPPVKRPRLVPLSHPRVSFKIPKTKRQPRSAPRPLFLFSAPIEVAEYTEEAIEEYPAASVEPERPQSPTSTDQYSKQPPRQEVKIGKEAVPDSKHFWFHTAAIEAIIKYEFKNEDLLFEAFQRHIGLREGDLSPKNKWLALVGDAILRGIIHKHSYLEGTQTRKQPCQYHDLHASNHSHVRACRYWRLDRYIRGGAANREAMADTMEAIIGAANVDGGWDASQAVVNLLYFGEILNHDETWEY
ncbi:ribonuclease III [Tothia fuscella]|uniref:Ribonuclease III n=1 Tax=Tothia fuscella TaxID=1048955 RepID=A0A9P4NPJ1_9PEZI|nr:ribonuclease III [Tothia fuscella]